MAKPRVKQLPTRDQVPQKDKWDLSSLFPDDVAWERALTEWAKKISRYRQFRGQLGEGPAKLAACLKFHFQMERLAERLGTYAHLRLSEDTTNSAAVQMHGRFMQWLTRAEEAASFIQPEIQALPEELLRAYNEARELAPYRVFLDRLLRMKPHTLSPAEERLLAMQTQMAQIPHDVFTQLDCADLKFGVVRDDRGRLVELSHSTFHSLLHSPSRKIRQEAFRQFYAAYDAHRHTLAATLAGAVYSDVYYARVRNFSSCLEAALFPERIPTTVYENLIATVRRFLPALQRYFALRRKHLRLRELRIYDTYVPLVAPVRFEHSWDEAVRVMLEAMQPLGAEYCQLLEEGLRGGWCDKYENRGKQSGAFSAGSYDGWPYILMNYRSDNIDHVFTLAHEAGHSMHSLLAARKQPFHYFRPVIFTAEIASTFNEQLLFRHMLARARTKLQRAFLIDRQLEEIRGTIFRQTMFAEFEKKIHEIAESGDALSVDVFRSVYRQLLEDYLAPEVLIDDVLSLECFRIPHFYHAFYVYKYATGMSAAMALADKVLSEGEPARRRYLEFLAAGSSKDPLDLVRDAGVDMETPTPIEAALRQFEILVEELEELLLKRRPTTRPSAVN